MVRGLDGFFDSLVALCGFEGHREGDLSSVSGGYGEGDTPLPIPNREVKPLSADGTWPARAWESRSPPIIHTSRPSGRLVLFRALRLEPCPRSPSSSSLSARSYWSCWQAASWWRAGGSRAPTSRGTSRRRTALSSTHVRRTGAGTAPRSSSHASRRSEGSAPAPPTTRSISYWST